MSEPFATIISDLTADAERLEMYGAADEGRAIRRCIQVIEVKAGEWELEALTLEQAATESGYSYSALEKMVRLREIENIGRKGNPRVRRGDLPRKARRVRRSRGVSEIAERILGYDPVPTNDRLVRRRNMSHIV